MPAWPMLTSDERAGSRQHGATQVGWARGEGEAANDDHDLARASNCCRYGAGEGLRRWLERTMGRFHQLERPWGGDEERRVA
jgi:hypothetical protein